MISSDQKTLVIKYHNDGMSNKEISIAMKININTIPKIINNNQNKDNKNELIVKKVGRKNKASSEIKNKILDLVKENY
jgi:transposase